MSKDGLGEFEELVLLAALRLGSEAYGLAISEEITETGGRPTVRAAVYVTLRRLEKRGLISTYRENTESRTGGKPRRLVRVEPDAIALLQEVGATRARLRRGLEPLLRKAP